MPVSSYPNFRQVVFWVKEAVSSPRAAVHMWFPRCLTWLTAAFLNYIYIYMHYKNYVAIEAHSYATYGEF